MAFTAARGLQVNSAGDDRALALKVFAGEVITQFDQINKFKDLHRTRTITSGKSAQFPAFGRVDAAYHIPGNEIAGQAANANEIVINIDGVLLAAIYIPNIDEALSHYELRSIYATEMTRALSRKFDARVAQVCVLAARKAATVTGGNAGTVQIAATAGTDVAVLKTQLWKASENMDNKDVPEDERVVVLRPAQYNMLCQDKEVVDVDLGGQGSVSTGKVKMYAGFEIVKSKNVPNTNVVAVAGENNTYSGDFTTTVAIAFHKSAVGTVKLWDLQTESAYVIEKQAHLLVAKYAMGHGVIRPESSVEIKSA